MIRNLINNSFVGIPAEYKAKEEMIRGTFVTVDYKKGEVAKATTLGDTVKFVVRDVKVTTEVANGLPVDDYSKEQDTIEVGEYVGVRTAQSGEQFKTTAFDATLGDTDVEAGKYLTVKNGVLAKPSDSSATKIVSLGWNTEENVKTLAFTIA